MLAKRGYLEDLWPYIENDPELGRTSILEAPLKAAEVDGGLYMLFNRFSIQTVAGPIEVVGDQYSWNLDELRVREHFHNIGAFARSDLSH